MSLTNNSYSKRELGCTESGKKSDDLKKYIQSRELTHKQVNKRFSKEGEYIMKTGYKVQSKNKSKPTLVKPSRIKSKTSKTSKSEKGKGKQLIVIMEKDVLDKYGYSDVKTLSLVERRKALKKAIKDNKPLSIYRRLVAISTLNKNKDLDLYLIFKTDAEWIKTQPEYINQKASSKSSKGSKASKKSKGSKSSKKSRGSKSSKSSKGSKKLKKQYGAGSEKYSTGYIPNYPIDKSIMIKDKVKSNSKTFSKTKNKLFYYK
jgi:hypothetical protein